MKFARFEAQDSIHYGILEGTTIREINNCPLEDYSKTGRTFSLADVHLLSPLQPGKALAVGLNYGSHVPEHLKKFTEEPQAFVKSISSLVGHKEPVIIPWNAGRVDAEGELVVVIGRRARKVRKEEALDYVFGYACGNDVSARIWQRDDLAWWRAKSSDTFGPWGPWITTGLDPSALELVTRINGEEIQRSSTKSMIFDIPTLISFFTERMTLEKGDIIFAGTPGRTGKLHPGDEVEVEISEIGTLCNPVQDED
jgi:2-keto-4-pentenoate hydratase/2-oxohepta-3-ene-1,7-dioic acid hydratase in catechol pathway